MRQEDANIRCFSRVLLCCCSRCELGTYCKRAKLTLTCTYWTRCCCHLLQLLMRWVLLSGNRGQNAVPCSVAQQVTTSFAACRSSVPQPHPPIHPLATTTARTYRKSSAGSVISSSATHSLLRSPPLIPLTRGVPTITSRTWSRPMSDRACSCEADR